MSGSAGALVGGFGGKFRSGLEVTAGATYRELPHELADRLTAELSLGKKLDSGRLELKAGAVRFGQRYQSFTLPYGQATYTIPLGRRAALQPSVRLGYYAADAGAGVSGWQADVFSPYVYAPAPSRVFAFGPTILRHAVGFGEQSYTSFGLRAASTIRTAKFNVEAGLQGRLTRFDEVDPFWGRRRKEEALFGSVMVSSDKMRIGPFLPAVGVSCDLTHSTIQYYQQRSCDMLFEVRKLF